jgi:hypothetical protein
MTSRERVYRTLEFTSPDRVPRDLWHLPIAWLQHGEHVKRDFLARWPGDLIQSPSFGRPPSPVAKGDPSKQGDYTDEWGCVYHNIKEGVHGEVKEPIVVSWSHVETMRLPTERLELDIHQVNAFCSREDRFVLGGGWARPFERMQFLRGTENVLVELALEEPGLFELLRKIHRFHVDLIEIGVDAINSQLFCMDIEEIGRRFAGRITFWGEIDRQHILPRGSVEDVRAAVTRVVDALYSPAGGVFAQLSWEENVPVQNADAVFATWDRLTRDPARTPAHEHRRSTS